MLCNCCKHSKCKIGSIELQIATMSKVQRSKIEEVYVCGFVPSYALSNKMPWSLDPFISPLVSDLEDAFINGKFLIITFQNL